MAADEIMTVHSSMTDEHDIARMSRLSLDEEEELEQHLTMDSSEEGDDADGEHSDKRHDDEEDDSDEAEAEAAVTPGRIRRPLFLPRDREYSSETDSSRIPRRRRTTCGRRAWEAVDSSSSDCRVVARPRLRKCCGGRDDEGGRLCMNIEEVKACRDLGFEIPFDWTVEIAGSPVAIETSSGGESSPISNWRISSPGDDPREVKARLKVWAQAVALATASHLSTG